MQPSLFLYILSKYLSAMQKAKTSLLVMASALIGINTFLNAGTSSTALLLNLLTLIPPNHQNTREAQEAALPDRNIPTVIKVTRKAIEYITQGSGGGGGGDFPFKDPSTDNGNNPNISIVSLLLTLLSLLTKLLLFLCHLFLLWLFIVAVIYTAINIYTFLTSPTSQKDKDFVPTRVRYTKKYSYTYEAPSPKRKYYVEILSFSIVSLLLAALLSIILTVSIYPYLSTANQRIIEDLAQALKKGVENMAEALDKRGIEVVLWYLRNTVFCLCMVLLMCVITICLSGLSRDTVYNERVKMVLRVALSVVFCWMAVFFIYTATRGIEGIGGVEGVPITLTSTS